MMKKILILILFCSFIACKKKEPVFTFVESNKQVDVHSDKWSKYSYSDFILVENVPKCKTKLKQLMIHHFLDLTSAIDSLQTNSNLNGVYCTFLKSTSRTKKRFTLTDEEKKIASGTYLYKGGRNSLSWCNNGTYVGSIFISRCEKDETKYYARMNISLGASNDNDFRTGNIKEDKYILLDECNSDWYETNKNDELVKYFKEFIIKMKR
jgi:hypothetical protein